MTDKERDSIKEELVKHHVYHEQHTEKLGAIVDHLATLNGSVGEIKIKQAKREGGLTVVKIMLVPIIIGVILALVRTFI